MMRGRKPVPLVERFWRKVNKTGPVQGHCGHVGPCWIWTGAIGADGYGSILRGSKVDGTRRSDLAHRVAFELERGAIPEGRQVNHECDNRVCVNPVHLHLGDHTSNAREKVQRGRAVRGSRHVRAKLDEAKVIAARRASAAGASNGALARQYGVGWRTMQLALSGKTWSHV